MNNISNKAKIMNGVVIGDNVIIEDDCYIDYGVIIRDNVHIKKGTFIGARCILGEYQLDFFEDYTNKIHPLVIGENSLIRSETIIYGDTLIGHSFQTGHRVTIRENTIIGNNCRIGTLSDVQGYCVIGNYVGIHSNVHIGQKSVIKDFVWIFPYSILTNDPTPPSNVMLGVTVNEYAVICSNSTILPGIIIGKDSLVGAGSVVTKNVGDGRIFLGNPAKDVGEVTKIKDREGQGSKYPWRYTFNRGMPWETIGIDNWEKLK